MYDVLHLVETDLKQSALSFVSALGDAFHMHDLHSLRDIYTRTAASPVDLPEFELIDADNPRKITKPGDYKETVKLDGLDRHYTVHVPPSFDGKKPMPVVVVLHGHGSDGAGIENLSEMNKEADKNGFIAVYPDAVQWFGRKEQSAWNDGNGLVPPGTNVNDVKFIQTVVDATAKQLPVDDKRVYAAGYSNGGMLAYELAARMPDKFAAVAAISSGMNSDEVAPGTPVSVLSIHGTRDPLIPVGGLDLGPDLLNRLGLPSFAAQDETAQFWAQNNGISGSPTVTRAGQVTKQDYNGGAHGSEVVQYTVSGGTHSWFGSTTDSAPPIDDSINATQTTWDFFASHPKNA